MGVGIGVEMAGMPKGCGPCGNGGASAAPMGQQKNASKIDACDA